MDLRGFSESPQNRQNTLAIQRNCCMIRQVMNGYIDFQ
jgi:hypothetical protein